MSQSNAHKKRTNNNSIKTILQNYKKCKLEKETRTWEWALKELKATTTLDEGSKIYVKFDVETSFTEPPDDDGDDSTIRSHQSATTWGVQEFSVSIEDASEDTESPSGSEDEQDIKSRVIKDETGKTTRVVNEQIIWWPAYIKRSNSECCPSLASAWKDLKDDTNTVIPPSIHKEVCDLVEERGDAPVWMVRYEPREHFDREEDLEWSAFFVDSSKLIHLEKGRLCVAPFKKALKDGSCPGEIHGRRNGDVCAFDALSAAVGVMESSVIEQASSAGENITRVTELAGGILKRFFQEMSRTSDKVVTAADVWTFFSKFIATGEGESEELIEDIASPTKFDKKSPGGGDGDELEEAPFPRLPDSP